MEDQTTPLPIVARQTERKAWPFFLVQTEGEGSPRNIILDRDRFILGRSDLADISIQGTKVSRKHALLVFKNQEYVLYDNDSQNGIFLNGIKVHSAVLRHGDYIQIGDSVFTYHEG